MAAYETYETDKDYDTMEMQNTPAAAPEATPPVIIERKSGNKTFKIFLGVILVALLLLVGGGVGLLLKSNLETSVLFS